jgi:hypothetical protein
MKIGTDANGHRTLDGARWHWPSKEDPRKCGEKGCTHQMGTLRRQPWQENEKKPKFRRRRKSS